MRVYLAGGFRADNWQQRVQANYLNISKPDDNPPVFINPKTKEVNNSELFKPAQVHVHFDLNAIKSCDVIFAYIDKGCPAVGVIAEIGYAVGLGIPVIFVTDPEIEGESDRFHKDRYFNFVRSMPNVVSFYNLDDAVKYLFNFRDLICKR